MAKGKTPPSVRGLRRLAFQLGLVACVVSSLGIGALGYTFTRVERQSLTRELTERVLAETQSLALAAAAPLLRHDPELGLHPLILRAESEVDALDELIVFNVEGTIVGHRDLVKVGQRSEALAARDPSAVVRTDGAAVWQDDTHLVILRPIEHHDERVGDLMARVDRSGIDAAVASAVRRTVTLAVVAAILSAVLVAIIVGRFLRPLDALRRGVQRIGSGDLETRVEVRGSNELALLAERINEMTEGLRDAQAARMQQERLEHELELARSLQAVLLPERLPVPTGYSLAAEYTPALEVSGDYYDVIPIGHARVGLVVADVSGKGVSGLVVMAMLRIVLRQLALSGLEPVEVLAEADKLLRGSLRRGMFITCCYGVLDVRANSFTWASAGHCAPVLFGPGMPPRELPAGGSPLGLLPPPVFAQGLRQHGVAFEPGYNLLLYSDGLTEAMDHEGNQLGEAAVFESLARTGIRTAKQALEALHQRVEEHRNGRSATDDLTMIVAQRELAGVPQPTDARAAAQPGVSA